MKPRRVVAPDEALAIFDLAVREHALVVVSIQEGPNWLTFKSRFLERDANRRFFVLDYQPEDPQNIPPLVPGQYAGLSFRHRSRKVMFSTVVEARGRFMLDNQRAVPAIRYRWPQTLTELQRRAYYRTLVPKGVNLLSSMWQGGVPARAAATDDPPSLVCGSLLDLSCGGCLVRLNDQQAPEWVDNATLGVEIQMPDGRQPLVVNANYRGPRYDSDGQLCAAIQFVGLEMTADGRAQLQRLASNIQRFHRWSNTAESSGRPPEQAR